MPVTRTSGQGRKRGVPNKINGDIRAMIVGALEDVGGREYLAARALDQPAAFMGLIGRVLPTQIAGEDGGPVIIDFTWAEAAPAPAKEVQAEIIEEKAIGMVLEFAVDED